MPDSQPAVGEQPEVVANPPTPANKYVSVKGLSNGLIWLLGIGIALSLMGFFSSVEESRLLSLIAEGIDLPEAELAASDSRQGIIGFVQSLLYLTTGIVWIVWFSRGYKNLHSFGATGLRFGYRWAIGSWLVPILHFVRPKAMTDDTWRASDPEAPADQGDSWKGKPVSPILHWWWALFVISNIVAWALFRAELRGQAESLEEIQMTNSFTIFANLVDIPLSILAILVVRGITDRQERRASKLRNGTSESKLQSDSPDDPA